MIVVVEILTTDGISFSAKSAKDPGIFWEKEFNCKLNIKMIVTKIVFNLNLFISTLYIVNNYKPNYCKN